MHTLEQHTATILVGLTVMTLLLIIALSVLVVRMRRLERAWLPLRRGLETSDASVLLADHARNIGDIVERLTQQDHRLADLTSILTGCIQHLGIRRYDAFEDVGGQQSFSLALLDGRHTGLIITGIYSRTALRIYVKHVRDGDSDLELTREEHEAIRHAIGVIR